MSVVEDVAGDFNLRRSDLADDSIELTRDENLIADLEAHVSLVVRVEIQDDKVRASLNPTKTLTPPSES